MANEVEKRIIRIISEITTIDEDILTLDDNLDQLGLDSLDRIEIALKLEDEFNIEFNDEQISLMDTIRSIYIAVSPRIHD